ncbi:hypothetical protein ABZY90_19800 [Streptomyces sp. NPDC006422]|uniref:hypothetical protein n=1 Tax=unclassified Streptomyces TaxID=2593676 RepID=UPI0033AEDB3D
MSARADIAAHFTSDVLADQLLDAYRAELLSAAVDALHTAGYREAAQHLRDGEPGLWEKSSRTAANATPTPRLAALLAAIHLLGGRWTPNTAARHYRRDLHYTVPHVPSRRLQALARGDLAVLAAAGHLVWRNEPGRQFYELKGSDRA